MKFYIVEGPARDALLVLEAKRKRAEDERRALCKQHKAKGAVTSGASLIGLAFDERKEIPKPWKLLKRSSIQGHASPDNTKEGRMLRKQMKEDRYGHPHFLAIAGAVGINNPVIFDRPYMHPSFVVWDDLVVIGVDDGMEPKKATCRRISDMEYEELLVSYKEKVGSK